MTSGVWECEEKSGKSWKLGKRGKEVEVRRSWDNGQKEEMGEKNRASGKARRESNLQQKGKMLTEYQQKQGHRREEIVKFLDGLGF